MCASNLGRRTAADTGTTEVLGFFGGITWALLVARVCQALRYHMDVRT